jgi:hypothetical protein
VGIWSGRAICEADGQAQKGRVTSTRYSAVDADVVAVFDDAVLGGS